MRGINRDAEVRLPRKAKAREDWSAAGLADLHRIRKTIDDRVLMANLEGGASMGSHAPAGRADS